MGSYNSFENFIHKIKRRTYLSLFLSVLVVVGFGAGLIFWSKNVSRGATTLSGTINGLRTISGDAVIKTNQTVTHDQGNTTGGTGLGVNVSGTLTLEAGAKIDVSGKGYKGGYIFFSMNNIGGYYYTALFPAKGSKDGNAPQQQNQAGAGGDWENGGAGGGTGYRTANRLGVGGGGGGAFGYGSGGKTNHSSASPGCYGGGGAGWKGKGGAGVCSGSAVNGAVSASINFSNDSWYNNEILFGAGGASGFTITQDNSEGDGGNSECVKGGNGGGAVKIKAKKLKIESGASISAAGKSGGKMCDLAYRVKWLTFGQFTLGAAGGGGTIYIEVDELELPSGNDYNFDVSGGDGWGALSGSMWASSGAGGGGIVVIRIAGGGKIKIGNNYVDNFATVYARADSNKGMLRNIINDVYILTQKIPDSAWGGDGKEIFAGNPTIPGGSTTCDTSKIKLTDPSFSSQPAANSHYQRGDTFSYKAQYISQDSGSNCSGKYQLYFQTALSNDLEFIGGSKLTPGNLDPTIGGGLFSTQHWEVNSAGSYTGDIKIKIKDNACNQAGGGVENKIQIYQKYDNGVLMAPSSGNPVYSNANIIVDCPGVAISGNVGASSITTPDLKIIGNSVVAITGSSSATLDSQVVNLSGYTHSINFSDINTNFEALKTRRAIKPNPWTNNFNLNKYNKPEGGVWKEHPTPMNRTFLQGSRGTIFHTGDLTIDGISWQGATAGVLGIVVKDGNVMIKDLNLKNVAIYAYDTGGAEDGKITFGTGATDETLDMTGSFVAKSIEIKSKKGNIKHSDGLDKNPPPGFSNLQSQIKILEKAR
ncbi:MAG: hypothetical protein CEN89_208 [Candidatus Berkelbacteria bacterium Licking1014_7]|uniref:Uncharacterized protein n=1 Tax=Candidatus Berkelbacteria bacterium Licking1014_7 TaxID=2017147 RepID=A0A554LK30_9BACT|nr:MAG: hypothetical protein CEN89_208 [Candidatus Berkelbacteria bacterium Licking1014_7]